MGIKIGKISKDYFTPGSFQRNSIFSAVQALSSIFCLFATYRILIADVGIDKFGLWSLLLAGSAAARLGDVSGAGGLARFVAERQAEKDDPGTVVFIHTILTSTIAFNLIAGLVVYILSDFLIARFVQHQFAEDVRGLIPIAILVALIMPAISNTLSSAVDGMQRSDQRAIAVVFSSAVLLLFTAVFVPKFGVWGFGAAQLVQQGTLVITTWYLLKVKIPNLGWVPYKLSKSAFWESSAFGVKIQLNNIAGLLSEPLAKSLLAYWGGVGMVGYYELASRLVGQLRGVFVNAMQPLIALIAGIKSDEERVRHVLIRSMKMTMVSGLGIVLLASLAAPIFSKVMIGEANREVVLIVISLAISLAINLFSVPLYFSGVGRGIMRWNILAQVWMAACVMVASQLLGPMFGGAGVILGIMAGHVGGTGIVGFGNAHDLGIFDSVRAMRWQIVASFAGIAAIGAAALSISVCLIGQ